MCRGEGLGGEREEALAAAEDAMDELLAVIVSYMLMTVLCMPVTVLYIR